MTEKTDQTDQTEANRYPPIKPPSPELALVQARSRMSKAWARANEAFAEFLDLDGRPDDAKEARKAAKEEWKEAAKHDKDALKLNYPRHESEYSLMFKNCLTLLNERGHSLFLIFHRKAGMKYPSLKQNTLSERGFIGAIH